MLADHDLASTRNLCGCALVRWKSKRFSCFVQHLHPCLPPTCWRGLKGKQTSGVVFGRCFLQEGVRGKLFALQYWFLSFQLFCWCFLPSKNRSFPKRVEARAYTLMTQIIFLFQNPLFSCQQRNCINMPFQKKSFSFFCVSKKATAASS